MLITEVVYFTKTTLIGMPISYDQLLVLVNMKTRANQGNEVCVPCEELNADNLRNALFEPS